MTRSRRAESWIVGGAIALSVSLTAGCGGSNSSQAGQPAASEPPAIEVVRVLQQPVNVTVSMPGQLDPYEEVSIYPRVNGFVKTISVDRGSHVHAGDPIALLEAPELAAERSEAQSKLQGAQAQLNAVQSKGDADASTYEKLKAASATPGVVAGNDLVLAQKAAEADQSQIVAAQQNIEAARQALQSVTEIEGYLKVTAPFDGVVTERNVHPGALVGPNSGPGAATPMVRLVANSRLRLVVPVPEAYIAGVTAGTEMLFSAASYPNQTFSGKIARIAETVDVKTRTMAVELDVMNKDGRLASGTFCQVRWPIHRPEPSLFVPAGSVASTTDRTFVIRIRNGRAEWVDVKAGLTSGPLVEVFGDLRPGDEVAARGTDEIRDGTSVRVKTLAPAAS
jgi:membrane fusion protein, multidrug efflux system